MRRLWNSTFVPRIHIADGRVARFEYEEPFASLLGTHKSQIVVLKDRGANRSTHDPIIATTGIGL